MFEPPPETRGRISDGVGRDQSRKWKAACTALHPAFRDAERCRDLVSGHQTILFAGAAACRRLRMKETSRQQSLERRQGHLL